MLNIFDISFILLFLYFAHFVHAITHSVRKIQQEYDNVNFHSKLDFQNSISFFFFLVVLPIVEQTSTIIAYTDPNT